MEVDELATIKTEPTDADGKCETVSASTGLRRLSSRQSMPASSLLTTSTVSSVAERSSNAGRATSARRLSSSNTSLPANVAQPKLVSPTQSAKRARPSALSHVLPRSKLATIASSNNGTRPGPANHKLAVKKSAPSTIGMASTKPTSLSNSSTPTLVTSNHIRIGFYGQFAVLINTLINDKSKAVCGVVYSSQTTSEEYMCNFCHYRANKLVAFANHVSTHVFQCNHCLFKSFACFDLVMHKKESHPNHAHELHEFDLAHATAISTGSPAVNETIQTSISAFANMLPLPAATSNVQRNSDKGVLSVPAEQKQQPATQQLGNKQYFTFRVHEDKNGYVLSLECEQCVFRTTSMGGLMSHSTTHRDHIVNRNDSIAVWECLYCRFASRRKKQVVMHIRHAHCQQNGGEVRMRKGVWAQVTQTMSLPQDGQLEGEWLWGCYYCTVNSTDRELVLAHESLEHVHSKLMITRKRLNEADKVIWGITAEASSSRKNNRAVGKCEVVVGNGQLANYMPELSTANKQDGDAPSPSSLTKATSRRKQPLPRRVVDDNDESNDNDEQSLTSAQSNDAGIASPSADDKEFVAVMVLDHVADDLRLDVSSHMQYDIRSNKGICVSCNYQVFGPRSLLEEHVLQAHILGDLWKCAYCNYKNFRRYGVVRHTKVRHRELPLAILRRKPFDKDQPVSLGKTELNYEVIGQVSSENVGVDVVVNLLREHWKEGRRESKYQFPESIATPTKSGSSMSLKFSGPKSVCEKQLLGLAKKAWACPHCARRSVLKSFIYAHISRAHPEQQLPSALQAVDRKLGDADEASMGEEEEGVEPDVKLLNGRVVLAHCNHSDSDEDTADSAEDNFATCPSDFSSETLAELGVKVELSQPLIGLSGSLMRLESPNDVNSSVYSGRPSTSKEATYNKFATPQFALSSLSQHESFGKYKCAYCQEFSEETLHLRQHLKANHSDTEPKVKLPQHSSNREKFLYLCPLLTCSYATTLKRELHSHLCEFPAHTGYGEVLTDDLLGDVETSLVNSAQSFVDAKIDERVADGGSKLPPTGEKRKCPPGWLTDILTKRRSTEGQQLDGEKTAKPSHMMGGFYLSEVHLRCYYCKHEMFDLNEMKEHLTTTHPLRESTALDLSGKKQRKIYLCSLLSCKACFTGSVLHHRHMRAHNVELASITAACHPEAATPLSTSTSSSARKEIATGSDNDNASAGESSEPSTKTLAARKAMLRSKRKEIAEKSSSGLQSTAVHCVNSVNVLCPYCMMQCDSMAAIKLHLCAIHANNPAVCHDITRLSAWNRNYRIVMCLKPRCNFYCYSSTDVLEKHECQALLSPVNMEHVVAEMNAHQDNDSALMECASQPGGDTRATSEQEAGHGKIVENTNLDAASNGCCLSKGEPAPTSAEVSSSDIATSVTATTD